MSDSRPRKPRPHWSLLVWPILTLWVLIWVIVPRSGVGEEASSLIPLLMVAAAILVALVHAVVGGIAQRRYDLYVIDESASACQGCGCEDCELHLIDYQGYVFIFFSVLHVSAVTGKFCEACARRRINHLFRLTLWGCILCPPAILWAWLHRQRELGQYIGYRRDRLP